MNTGLHIIEPTSFPLDERKIRKSAMDYMTKINFERHSSWYSFREWRKERRVILMSTKASVPYTQFEFQDDDILLAGSESAGVPENVHNDVEGRVLIPMAEGLRSLNIVNATSMILGETLRQTRWT